MKITAKQLRNFVTEEVDYLNKRSKILTDGTDFSVQSLVESRLWDALESLHDSIDDLKVLKIKGGKEPLWMMYRRMLVMDRKVIDWLRGEYRDRRG